MAEQLMTTEETGAFLNTPAATVRWWRYTGTGPRSFKLGARKVMYLKSDVEEWLQMQYEADGSDTDAA